MQRSPVVSRCRPTHPGARRAGALALLLAGCTSSGGGDDSAVSVGNHPPELPAFHLEPAAPQVGDALALVVDQPAADADGDALEWRISWWDDGVRIDAAENAEQLDGRWVGVHETLTVAVQVTDGEVVVGPATASVTTPNTPPALSAVRIATVDGVLRAGQGASPEYTAADADGDRLAVSFGWLRDGVAVPELDGQARLPPGVTHAGEWWSVQVEAGDGRDTVRAVSEAVEVIEYSISDHGYQHAGTLRLELATDGDGTVVGAVGEYERSWTLDNWWDGSGACTAVWALASHTNRSDTCVGCTWAFYTDAVEVPDRFVESSEALCADLHQPAAGTLWLAPDLLTLDIAGPTMNYYDRYGAGVSTYFGVVDSFYRAYSYEAEWGVYVSDYTITPSGPDSSYLVATLARSYLVTY